MKNIILDEIPNLVKENKLSEQEACVQIYITLYTNPGRFNLLDLDKDSRSEFLLDFLQHKTTNLLKNYKVNINKPLPGLVGLKVENSGFKSLDGLRTKGILSILDKKTKMVYWKEAGEIQFKSDGISGIVTMHAATYLNRRNDGFNKYLLCRNDGELGEKTRGIN